MLLSSSIAKQLALIAGLSLVIGAALAVAGITVHNATQPSHVLPFGLDAYLGQSASETLNRLKYELLIDKEVEVRNI